jgi:hypothetical protein
MWHVTIDHTDFALPDTAPVASIIKHLQLLQSVCQKKLGDDYVYVIKGKANITISTINRYGETMTESEYQKRMNARRRAIPDKAGPDAHGHNITTPEE